MITEFEFDYKMLSKRCKDLKPKVIKYLQNFRELGSEQYTYKMYEYTFNIQNIENTVRSILHSLIATETFKSNIYYSIINENYDYNDIDESELKSLIIEYTEFLEFIICVKHELKYVITVAYSNTNGYRATKEQISEAFSKFSNIKKLLLEQGDPYDI